MLELTSWFGIWPRGRHANHTTVERFLRSNIYVYIYTKSETIQQKIARFHQYGSPNFTTVSVFLSATRGLPPFCKQTPVSHQSLRRKQFSKTRRQRIRFLPAISSACAGPEHRCTRVEKSSAARPRRSRIVRSPV